MKIDIEQVKAYIDENLNQLRKSQQVAAHLNCSVERLKRSFLKAESLSVSNYIRATKIARMKSQLQNSEAPCKVICLDLGLREDVGARLFKNVTGMTMESYRRLCRHDDSAIARPARPNSDPRRPEPRLVLTEGVIRQILSSTEPQSRIPTKHRTGILIQGPSN
jgi:AraC-like DNA-binding protein